MTNITPFCIRNYKLFQVFANRQRTLFCKNNIMPNLYKLAGGFLLFVNRNLPGENPFCVF